MTDNMEMFSLEMLYQGILTGIEVFGALYFFIRLLHKKMGFFLYLLFGGCTVCAICFVPGKDIIRLGIFALSLAAAGVFACQTDGRISALYAVLTVEIIQLGYGLVKSLASILYPYLSGSWQKTSGFVLMLAEEMAVLLLTGGCCFLIKRYFSDRVYFFRHGVLEKQYILPVFIPVLMLLIMDEYIHSFSYGIVVTSVDGRETYLHTNYYQMLVMQFLEIAGLFCILFAYKKLLYSFHLSTELSLLEQEENSLRQYVEEAKERYEKTKSFRHDIKNHITVVKELIQKGQTQQALNYIGNMESMTAALSFPCHTNNPVVDILLANKLGMAKSSGICVHCSLLFPCPCAANDIDLCIILSNALDNAIRACREMDGDTEKYIRVTGGLQGDFVLMEVENSFHRKGTLRKGTGLTNINAVAEKYHGAMSIKTEDGIFTLSVLLVIPQQESRGCCNIT